MAVSPLGVEALSHARGPRQFSQALAMLSPEGCPVTFTGRYARTDYRNLMRLCFRITSAGIRIERRRVGGRMHLFIEDGVPNPEDFTPPAAVSDVSAEAPVPSRSRLVSRPEV